MDTLASVAELRSFTDAPRRSGRRIGFVPTMGNLHEGHLQLVRRARQESDLLVASVFVNPLQFGPGEDYDAYPRTFEADCTQLRTEGVDGVFAPAAREMYPDGMEHHTRVHVPGLSDILCGASRPGHFDGVATVVAKLLGAVAPEIAVFGEKDYQQLLVIRRMVADLCLGVRIDGAPIARADDGLALSSRNSYLSEDERARAPELYRTLCALRDRLLAGERELATLTREGRERLEIAGFRPDYVEIRRAADLAEPAPGDDDLIVLGAAHLGKPRLIDNVRTRS